VNNNFLNFILAYNRKHDVACRRMIDHAHQASLRVTHFVGVSEMRSPDTVRLLKQLKEEYKDEIVLWLTPDRQMLAEQRIDEQPGFYCYFSRRAKQKLARAMVRLYEQTFDAPMEATAFFNLDAFSIAQLKKASPALVSVMAACFEEGLNVLHGHRYFDLEWLCFTEGGPWWPWVPAADNTLRPAGKNDPRLEVVCLPHLNRDLMMSFDSRDDFFSSQPMDEMRSKSVWAGNIDYTKRFFEQYMRQAEINNGYAYYQFFETCGPFTVNSPHVFDESPKEFARVFFSYVDFLGEQVRRGAVKNVSMAEFGQWFWKRFEGGTPPAAACWKDIRHPSGKKYFWYLDRNMRLLMAPDRGGAVLDLRPYAAMVSAEAGIDTKNLWDMNYPFLIQNHHRYTSICKGMFKYKDKTLDLAEEDFAVKKIVRADMALQVVYQPKKISLAGVRFVLEISVTIHNDGKIVTRRTIRRPSGGTEEIEFCEYFRGTWGSTDIPGNLKGIFLAVQGGHRQKVLRYAHRKRELVLENARRAEVYFPGHDFSLALEGSQAGWTAIAREGNVFQAFYEISLEKKSPLVDGATFVTSLVLQGQSGRKLTESAGKNVFTFRPPFKKAWGPSLAPLRCPKCLQRDVEVHLVERNGRYRCQFCSFTGRKPEIFNMYESLRRRTKGNK